eukprot:1858385-Alexandrium_andersonii.AAC.1
MQKQIAECQRRGEELDRREAELEKRVKELAHSTEVNRQSLVTANKNIALYGRRAELALASALWCSDAQKSSENRLAAREAITTEWPKSMPLWPRRQTVG